MYTITYGLVSSFEADFEKAHLIFNISALHNQIAHTGLKKGSFDSIKKAAHYFQLASGCLRAIDEKFQDVLSKVPVLELSSSCIKALIKMNLGLSHECFCAKLKLDELEAGKSKDSPLSKVSSRCAELFTESYDTMVSDAQTEKLFKEDWRIGLQYKALYFNSLAQQRMARICAEKQCKYGEQVARLRAAKRLLSAAKEFHKVLPEYFLSNLQALLGEVEQELLLAEKDNDIIYMNAVPEEVSPIEKANLADLIPFDEHQICKKFLGKSLFNTLYPKSVLEMIREFNQRKSLKIAAINDMSTRSIKDCYKKLSNAGLPGSLQLYEIPSNGVDDILVGNMEVTLKLLNGRINTLTEKKSNLDEASSLNQSTVNEIQDMLKNDKEAELTVERQFVKNWRPDIRQSDLAFERDYQEQLSQFQKGLEGDRKIEEVYNSNIQIISAISANGITDIPTYQLKMLMNDYVMGKKSNMPSPQAPVKSTNLLDSLDSSTKEIFHDLKKKMDELTKIKRDRQVLVQSLETYRGSESADTELGEKLMKLNSNESQTRTNETSVESIFDSLMEPINLLSAEISANMQQQDKLLQKVLNLDEQFKQRVRYQDRSPTSEIKQTQHRLEELKELVSDTGLARTFRFLDEGINFHKKFNDQILRNGSEGLWQKCVEYCKLRRTDRHKFAGYDALYSSPSPYSMNSGNLTNTSYSSHKTNSFNMQTMANNLPRTLSNPFQTQKYGGGAANSSETQYQTRFDKNFYPSSPYQDPKTTSKPNPFQKDRFT